MSTSFPGALDSTTVLPNNRSNATLQATNHPNDHNNLADALLAMQKPIVGPVVFNVKGYGAAGDNAADDTAEIQAAIDAANAAGGGVVLFPPGTYLSNKLTLYSKVSLIGWAGPEATVLKLRNTQNTALLTTSGFVTTDTAGGIHSFVVQGITFDGNKANQTSNADSGLVQVYGYNYAIRDVKIRNAETVGLYTNYQSGTSSPGPDGIAMEAHLDRVEVFLCGTAGIYWNGPHDSNWHAVIAHENGTRGFEVAARGNALKAVSCHSWGLSQTYAWYIAGTAVQCLNCEAEGASTKQVYIGANDCQWIGGQIYAAGGATTGIEVANNAAGLNIQTKVLNCTTAAIAFTADGGGSSVALNVYGTSGATVTGTVSDTTDIRVNSTGGQVPRFLDRFQLPVIWTQENSAANQSAVALNIYGDTTRQVIPMLRGGCITGVMVRSTQNRTNGSLTVTVYKNGSPTSLTAVLDGSNVTFKGSYAGPGAITFGIGDEIGVRVTTDAAWAPTTADITVVVEVMRA